MKLFLHLFKLIVYSNIFVSFCVTAFTHLTYLIYNLPTHNLLPVLLLVFCFTYFTYNGQRIVRLKKNNLYIGNLGERLIWVNNSISFLLLSTMLTGIVGFICTFYLSANSWYILVPCGLVSFLYVIPKLGNFSTNKFSLRQVPYIKVILIAVVWGITIVWLPFAETQVVIERNIGFDLALYQTILFVIAITLPFDIRDLKYDKASNLKTLPQLLGVKKTIIASELLLLTSATLLFFIIGNPIHLLALLIGHLITIVIVAYSNENRKELFFAGLIESTSLILWLCVIIADYLSSL